VQDYVGGLAAAGDEADEAAEAADEFREALEGLRSGSISVMEAEVNFADAVRDARDQLEDMTGAVVDANGKLDLHTEAGSAAFRALVDLGDASNDVITSLQEQGSGQMVGVGDDAVPCPLTA
jgi:hypothetical protein